MIAIDELLEYYTNDVALREMEGVLSNLLQRVQALKILMKEANHDRGIK
jgi:hypothetical protein